MHVDPLVSAVAVLGMAFLLFLAGFEVDVRGLAGADGRVAGRGLLVSLVLAGLAAGVLLRRRLAGQGRPARRRPH